MTYPVYLVFTNAVEGREDEFNDWYDNVHLSDVVKVPGIVSGTRFKLSDVQRSDVPFKYKYAAVYQLDTHDIGSVVAELKKRAGTEVMPLSSAMEESRESYYFERISSRTRSA